MGYLDRLRARESGNEAIPATDETDKTPFVSFGSSTSRPLSRNAPESAPRKGAPSGTDKTDRTAEREEIRRHLIRLLPGEDHPDFPEAFALALRSPGALECLRLCRPPKAPND